MHSNPFDTPAPAVSAEAPELLAASRLPVRFMLAAFGTSLLGFLVTLISLRFNMEAEMFEGYLSSLPMQAAQLLCGMLMNAVGALLLSRHYLERYGIREYRQHGAVLSLYLVLYLVIMLGFGYLYGWLTSHLMHMMYEQSGSYARVAMALEPLSWLHYAVVSLLPVWLSLTFMRKSAQMGAQARTLPGWEPAIAFSLCFAVLYLKCLGALSGAFAYGNEWLLIAMALSCLLYGVLVFAATLTALPRFQVGLLPGRLILASVVCMLMWVVVAAFGGVGLAILLYLDMAVMFVSLLYGLIMLALLWPATRLSLRWLYRPQAA